MVCGGGNNLSNIQLHRPSLTIEIDHMIRTIQRMCEIIRAFGCKVIFILPDDFQPECDVPEHLQQQAISRRSQKGVSFSVVEEGVDDVDR